MKKVAVAAAVAAFALMGAMSGCASDEVFTAQTYVEEGEVRSVSVDVSDRAVELAPSEDGKLRIDYYESEKTSYSISLSEEGVLSVTLDLDQSWTDFVGGTACGGVPHDPRLSPAGADRRFGEHDQRGDLRNRDDRGAERLSDCQRRRSVL